MTCRPRPGAETEPGRPRSAAPALAWAPRAWPAAVVPRGAVGFGAALPAGPGRPAEAGAGARGGSASAWQPAWLRPERAVAQTAAASPAGARLSALALPARGGRRASAELPPAAELPAEGAVVRAAGAAGADSAAAGSGAASLACGASARLAGASGAAERAADVRAAAAGWAAARGAAAASRLRLPAAEPQRPRSASRSLARVARSAFAAAIASVLRLCGPITMIMFRPSCLGEDSTKPSSSMSPARRWSSLNPSSGRDCSRPLNMIVTLTLSPCLRKRSTWPFLVP